MAVSLVSLLPVFVVCCCVLSAGLGEFRIRDLNDEINKLLREKRHWEERIVELGGTDYIVSSNHEEDGREWGGEGGRERVEIMCEKGGRLHLIIADVSQKTGPKMLDHEGKSLPGNRGYKWEAVFVGVDNLQFHLSLSLSLSLSRYFGAARDLPGVRDLFEQARELHTLVLPV